MWKGELFVKHVCSYRRQNRMHKRVYSFSRESHVFQLGKRLIPWYINTTAP
ncbi:hypothetical protein HanIR_Chr02g0095951 [Helianthus annuus]|nr:hypothetical protein HanIR_Chr02g0095951 [Helianthus annuus]